MKRRAIVGFAFAAVVLTALVNVIGSEEILSELAAVNYRYLALGVVSGALALTFRGFVWTAFLRHVDETMTRTRVGAIFLTAMFVKYVTPYGQVTTEPFAAYLVSQDGKLAYEDALAGVISADLLNYVPYYTFGFLGVLWIGSAEIVGGDMATQVVAFVSLFVVGIVLLYVAVRHPPVVYRLVLEIAALGRGSIGRFSSRVRSVLTESVVRQRLDGFYGTIDTITSDKRLLATGVLSAHAGMLFLMLPVYIGASALGYRLSFAVVAVTVALGKLGSVVPAPGGTGGVEAIVTAGLTALGNLDWATAFTIALIYRLCTYWLTVGVGGFCGIAFVFRK